MCGEQALAFAELQAFVFSIIRNLKPENVFEIGRGSEILTQVICQALQSNAAGILHATTAGVADRDHPLFDRWPSELRRFVRVYPADAISFINDMRAQGIRSELIVLNGLPDYEFLSVVIEAASVAIKPGGTVVITGIHHVEVYRAVRDFVSQHPEWAPSTPIDERFATDQTDLSHSSAIAGPECAILLAPAKKEQGNRS
jgi:hypothetical protein